MIEIFRYNNKWRLKIINETLEFDNRHDFEEVLRDIIQVKEIFESNKYLNKNRR